MTKPTPEEIAAYLTNEKNYDEFTAMGFADQFWNYYESVGWKVGKNSMVSWKAAIRTWEIKRKNNVYGTNKGPAPVIKLGTSEARLNRAKDW